VTGPTTRRQRRRGREGGTRCPLAASTQALNVNAVSSTLSRGNPRRRSCAHGAGGARSGARGAHERALRMAAMLTHHQRGSLTPQQRPRHVSASARRSSVLALLSRRARKSRSRSVVRTHLWHRAPSAVRSLPSTAALPSAGAPLINLCARLGLDGHVPAADALGDASLRLRAAASAALPRASEHTTPTTHAPHANARTRQRCKLRGFHASRRQHVRPRPPVGVHSAGAAALSVREARSGGSARKRGCSEANVRTARACGRGDAAPRRDACNAVRAQPLRRLRRRARLGARARRAAVPAGCECRERRRV
jgi:hypothetical protein